MNVVVLTRQENEQTRNLFDEITDCQKLILILSAI
jgi:hypothetical protein